jgi:hypothetical protein
MAPKKIEIVIFPILHIIGVIDPGKIKIFYHFKLTLRQFDVILRQIGISLKQHMTTYRKPTYVRGHSRYIGNIISGLHCSSPRKTNKRQKESPVLYSTRDLFNGLLAAPDQL